MVFHRIMETFSQPLDGNFPFFKLLFYFGLILRIQQSHDDSDE